MYIGPLEPRNETNWVLARGEKRMEEQALVMSPGLVQIFNEILVNAVDRQYDSAGDAAMSVIDIEVDPKEGSISIENDGGSMPVAKHTKTGLYVPSLVFGEFLSGDNFDDSRVRFVGGRNGVGAKATNVFSKRFEVEVNDPANQLHFMQTWEDNMRVRREPEISKLEEGRRHSVKIKWWPDLRRFGLRKLNKDHLRLFKARAYDAAACTNKKVAVRFGGKNLTVEDFDGYARSVLGRTIVVERIKDETGAVRAEVAVALSEEASFKALGLVNGIRCSSGTHVRLVADQLAAGIASEAPKRNKKASSLLPATVRRYLKVVVKVLVDRPGFDSQTKSRLTTVANKLGFDLALSGRFIREAAAKLGILEAAIAAQSLASRQALSQASKGKLSMVKLDDATLAGKGTESCTLILTEGDSAKGLAVAGVGDVGRRNYGVFPLKGKLLNVRTATHKQLKENQEILNIVQILGLQWGREYNTMEDVQKLRYQRVMIFSDQDLDGHHIAGLVVNFIHANWPSLLETCPDFIQRFATPIVKVFPKGGKDKKTLQEFFTQSEFNAWQQTQPAGWEKRFRVKYYKGLGTSTREEAIVYFRDLDRHVISFLYEGEGDSEAVKLAFEPDRVQNRKDWIQGSDFTEELDYAQSSVPLSDFFNKQYVHYSAYDCKRSIPLLLDGLKPSQRKVLHVVRKELKEEMKVSQLTGLVSSKTSYHHGEESLVETIVSLARDFVGTNNVNMLKPSGNFGCRLTGTGKHHAAGRYIYTEASELCGAILRSEDDEVLRLQREDGQLVEPKELLPVVPLALFNGFKGIGTGWATDGPNYHPLELTAALERLIRGEEPGELLPWYDGFKGTIKIDEEGKVYSYGRWRVFSSEGPHGTPDTVEVTELPVGVWMEDWQKKLEDDANSSKIMLSYERATDYNDETVHFLVGFNPEQVKRRGVGFTTNATKAIGKLLRLKKRLLTNMWLYHAEDIDAEPKLTYFETPQDVLRAFHRVRRRHYQRRRDHLLARLSKELVVLENKVRFVRSCGDGSLDIRKLSGKPLAEAEQELDSMGYQRLDPSAEVNPDAESAEGGAAADVGEAGFSYLLSMSFRSLTLERAEELERKRQRAAEELERVQANTVDELWLADLRDFREAYERRQRDRAEAAAKLAESSGKATEPEARKAHEREVQKRFMKERRRFAKSSDTVDLSVATLMSRTAIRLRSLCKMQKLPVTGTKMDLVNRLLVATTGTNFNWRGLGVEELRAHAVARSLSPDGVKTQLVERLEEAAALLPITDMRKADMAKELRGYGVLTRLVGTDRQELVQRLKLARAKLRE